MKNPSFYRKSYALALAMSALVAPVMAQTQTDNYLNFTDETIDGVNESIITYQSFDYHAAVVGDALFRRAEDTLEETGSGAGSFTALYKVKNTGIEQGYNRHGVNDSTVTSGGGPRSDGSILKSEMLTDNSGNFFIIAIDVNESGSSNYISLDRLQVWAGAVTPDPLPEVTSDPDTDLANLGTQIYNMDSLSDTTVFLDSTLTTGGGGADLFVFVSTSLFDHVAPDEQIYIYTAFGAYDGATDMSASAGDEDIAILSDESISNIGIVPEPSSALMVALGGVMCVLRRRRA